MATTNNTNNSADDFEFTFCFALARDKLGWAKHVLDIVKRYNTPQDKNHFVWYIKVQVANLDAGVFDEWFSLNQGEEAEKINGKHSNKI